MQHGRAVARVGVVGLGRWGQNHCRVLGQLADFELVAVYDSDPKLLHSVATSFSVEPCRTLAELLHQHSLDLVVLATPHSTHNKLALASLEAKLHVVVEKPIALSVVDLVRMVETAQRVRRIATVHSNYRWEPSFQAVRRLVQSGVVGDVFSMESRFHQYGEEWSRWGIHGLQDPWRLKRAAGGGIWYDWAPHLIDQALLLTPAPPISVYAHLQSRLWSNEVDDHAFCHIRFENGSSATLEASADAYRPLPRWFVLGTRGTLQCDQWSPRVSARFVREDRLKEVTLEGNEQTGSEFFESLGAVLRGDFGSIMSPRDLFVRTQIMEAATESSRRNRVVTLKKTPEACDSGWTLPD